MEASSVSKHSYILLYLLAAAIHPYYTQMSLREILRVFNLYVCVLRAITWHDKRNVQS